MTDEEFDVLDELYFIQSFKELMVLTGKSAEELVPVLQSIHSKGWIKVFENVAGEIPLDTIDFQTLADNNHYFLATKSGLMAHNS